MEGFLNPKQVLKQLEIKGNITAVDFGSGSGGWAIPLAKRLKFGKIYAIDILEEPLSALKNKAEIEKAFNIQVIRSNIEKKKGSTLPDASCDLVLITNLLFQVDDKKIILEEAKRVLKNKGKVLVVDWLPEAVRGPEKGRVSSEKVKEIADELNLRLEKEFQAGVFHYALVFNKP